MIYVLAGTQVATLIAFCFVLSWVIGARDDVDRAFLVNQERAESRLERVMRERSEEMQKLFEAISEKAFIEREQLLNRLTHPDIAAAATPTSVKGDIDVEDDEEDMDPLAEPAQGDDYPDRIPMNDLLVRPREPVGPLGAMTFEDDEEENDDGVS